MGSNSLVSRPEARAKGVKIYYNGPCKRGHVSGRYTSNGSCIECVRDFSKKFPEVNRQAVTRYQKSNPDKIRNVLKRWRKRNPTKVRLQKYRRRHAVGKFSHEDIQELLELQDHMCAICFEEFNDMLKYEIDHIKPLSKGGTNWPTNLQLLCRSCNAKKSAKYYV